MAAVTALSHIPDRKCHFRCILFRPSVRFSSTSLPAALDALPSGLALAAAMLASNTCTMQRDAASSCLRVLHSLGPVYLTVQRVESNEQPSLSAFILFGLLMGLAVMMRPTNAVYALLFLVSPTERR